MTKTAIGIAVCILLVWSANAADQPDTPLDYLKRGDGYLDAHEYGKAIAEYNHAIQLKPDFPEALNNRAYAYYSKYDGTGNPLADLNRAITLRPDLVHAYNTRGCVFMAGGDPDRAIADFNRAIELQPDYPRAYRNRANAYLRKGELRLAIADFERAGENPKRIILCIGIFFLASIALIITISRYIILRHQR